MNNITMMLSKREVAALLEYWKKELIAYESLGMLPNVQLCKMKIAIYEATLGRMS